MIEDKTILDKFLDELENEESTGEPEDEHLDLLNKLLSSDISEHKSSVSLPEDIKQEMGKQLIEINKLLKGK